MSQGDFIKEICGCLTGLIDKRDSFNNKNIFYLFFIMLVLLKIKQQKNVNFYL